MHDRNIRQFPEALRSVPETGAVHSQEKYPPGYRHMYKGREHSAAWRS